MSSGSRPEMASAVLRTRCIFDAVCKAEGGDPKAAHLLLEECFRCPHNRGSAVHLLGCRPPERKANRVVEVAAMPLANTAGTLSLIPDR